MNRNVYKYDINRNISFVCSVDLSAAAEKAELPKQVPKAEDEDTGDKSDKAGTQADGSTQSQGIKNQPRTQMKTHKNQASQISLN